MVAGLVPEHGVQLNTRRAACLLQNKRQLERRSDKSYVSRHTKALYTHHQQELIELTETIAESICGTVRLNVHTIDDPNFRISDQSACCGQGRRADDQGVAVCVRTG